MGVFKRTSKYRKLSTISEKEKFLNAELVKTGMLDENAPANSTSGVYFATATTSEPVAPSVQDVPDTSGVTAGSSYTQAGGEGKPESGVWTDPGYSDNSDLINNDGGNADGKPILNSPWNGLADNSGNPSGSAGFGAYPSVWGTKFVTFNSDGTASQISDSDSSPYAEAFREYRDSFIAAGWPPNSWLNPGWVWRSYWQNFSIYNPRIDAYWPGSGSTPEYGGIVKGELGGTGANQPMALLGAYVWTGDQAKYNDPGTTGEKIVLQRAELGDPDFFPGDAQKNKKSEEEEAKEQLGIGDRAWDWLNDVSQDDDLSFWNQPSGPPTKQKNSTTLQLHMLSDDDFEEKYGITKYDYLQLPLSSSDSDSGTYASVSGNEDPVEVTVDVPPPTDDKDGEVTDKDVKKWADKVRDSVGNYLNKVRDFYSDFDTAKDNLSTLVNTLQSVPTSGNTLQNYLNNNDPNHPDYRKNDPRSNNYQGPYEAKTDTKWKNKVGSQIKKSIPSWSDMEERAKNSSDGKTELTNKEITAISNSMHPSNNGSMEFHTLLNSLPVSGDSNSDDIPGKDAVTTVTLDKDGNIDIVTNYRFTDRDDVSAGGPPMKMYVNHFMQKDKGDSGVPSKDAGTYGYYEKDKSVAPYGSDENPLVGTTHDINVRLKLNINGGNSSNWGKKGNENKKFEGMMKNIYNSYEPEGDVLSEGWQSPEHVNVDKNERKRWFNPKDIKPEFPEKAPPEQVDGWHPDLKKKEEEPIPTKEYIKIKEEDLLKNHRLKDKERKEFIKTINSINVYLTKNPSALIHAQQRYPKSDPRLAELNWKMDTMLGASKEFMDKKYPENTRLFNQLQKSVKRSIKLTNPTTFKVKVGKETSYKKLLSVNYVENIYDKLTKTETKFTKNLKNKKSASRFFRKEKPKTKSELIDLRLKQLEIDMQKTLTNA